MAADVVLFPSMPWSLRPFVRSRVSPIWLGLAISAAWFGFYLLYTSVLGDGIGKFDAIAGDNWPSELGWSLIIGMAPAVTAASLRGAARDLDDLAPVLRVSPARLEGLSREIATVPRGLITGIGGSGAVLTAILTFHQPSVWVGGQPPPIGDPAVLWYVGRNVVNWWLISRAITIDVTLARAFSRLAVHLPEVDLVDRTPLAPFGRRGLRSVLLWMLYLSLFSVQYVFGSAQPALGAGLLIVVGVAIAAFLLPVWGAHQRLRKAKAAEMARVREQLALARERTLGAPPGEVAGGHLADLVAWEQRVSAAGEWPFTSSTVMRFALYTAIGLGSWMGAAFVERLLESALG